MTEKKARRFRDITADFYKFDVVNQAIEGTLIAKDSMEFNRAGVVSEVGKYTLETDDGDRISFLGGTVLDQTLMGVQIGSYIRITYTGTKPSKQGMDVKQFRVELAE